MEDCNEFTFITLLSRRIGLTIAVNCLKYPFTVNSARSNQKDKLIRMKSVGVLLQYANVVLLHNPKS